MSSSILLNCKENVSDHLGFDVMYMDWLTSPTPSHISKIISSSSHNYSGTLKKKKESRFLVQWVDLVLHISIYPGNQGRVISCSVDSTSCDVVGFRPLFIELVLSSPSSFSLCTPTSTFKVADFIFLLWFCWCSIQRLPTLVAGALFFLLRASKTCHLSKEVIAPICSWR